MESDALKFLFEKIQSLNIKDCDVFINRPTIFGDKENMSRSYVIVAFPNGIEYFGAYARATGMITIGSKDKNDLLGLPNAVEFKRISDTLQGMFPILTDDYTVIDYEFSSDHSEGIGWHEYYYTFQIYINKSN